jgi:lysosomal acid lipase/cholesteryl ester hydrolase
MSDAEDVSALEDALPAATVVYRREEPSYQHLDFTWGINAHELIYPSVLRLLRRYHAAPPRAEGTGS